MKLVDPPLLLSWVWGNYASLLELKGRHEIPIESARLSLWIRLGHISYLITKILGFSESVFSIS